jgi:GTP-binding protein
MLFVDRAEITVKAGDGGRGCSSLAQPPYIRYPYPDGGDGGRGGDIILHADPNVATLLDFQFRHEFSAGRGGHGGSNNKTGRHGEDRVIAVPVGTAVFEGGALLRDMVQDGERVVVANGGAGGRGNAALWEQAKSPRGRRPSRHQGAEGSAARRGASDMAHAKAAETGAEDGARGETRQLVLELKLIAEVGLIGLPNAGKSSLLSRISSARPKVAAYPFTTRYPVLGVVQAGNRGTFVACDIPGLIEGAHQGKGLGMQFLRHIERTRVLAHVVDTAAVDGGDPVEAYRQVNRELQAYHPAVAAKPQVVVANKMDLPQARANLDALRRAVKEPVYPVSCATGEGLDELVKALWVAAQSAGAAKGAA